MANLRPVIDRNRCEGKGECVRVCPNAVFELGTITAPDRAGLSFLGKLKSLAHRGKTVYTPRAADCAACGVCVTSCPEDAIKLRQA